MERQLQRVPYFINMALFSILLLGAAYEKNMMVSSFPSSLYLPANLKNLSRVPAQESEARSGAPVVVPVADVYYEYEYDDGVDIIPPATLSPKQTDDIQHPFSTVVDIEAFLIFYGAIALGVVAVGVLVSVFIWSYSQCKRQRQCGEGHNLSYEAASTTEDLCQSQDHLAAVHDIESNYTL